VRPARIDQVVPSFGSRDAIGVHMLHLRQLLRDLGYRSDIWCVGAFPEVRAECRLLEEMPARRAETTWLVYHLSNGSPAAEVVLGRDEPLVVDYHNITPGRYFRPWVPWAEQSSEEGRRQARALAARAFFAMADSAFNEEELRAFGYRASVSVPPLFDPSGSSPDAETCRRLEARRSGGGTDWLFVGRLAPNKAQHDLLKALACFSRLHDPRARLHLVGTTMDDEYPRALRRFAAQLGVGDRVHFPGSVSDPVLAAYYACADVFVCASEHEGFCIPLVEAMHHGLPVVAYRAAAVPETAGAGALVVGDKSPLALASAVARVLGDEGLRRRLVDAGRRRAGHFTLARGRARWEQALRRALEVAGTERVAVAS
jgi:glycosyltransferase involved in cell wall biosynthesis